MHRRGGYNVPWTEEEIETTIRMYKRVRPTMKLVVLLVRQGMLLKLS